MQTTIGAFDASTRRVSVLFAGANSSGEAVTFTRDVNACLDESGGYDADATAARVAAVALAWRSR